MNTVNLDALCARCGYDIAQGVYHALKGDAQRAASLAGETLRIVFGVDDARSVIIRI